MSEFIATRLRLSAFSAHIGNVFGELMNTPRRLSRIGLLSLSEWILVFALVLSALADIWTTLLVFRAGGEEVGIVPAIVFGRTDLPGLLAMKVALAGGVMWGAGLINAPKFAGRFGWTQPILGLVVLQILAASQNAQNLIDFYDSPSRHSL